MVYIMIHGPTMLKIPISTFKIMSSNVIRERNVHFTILSQDISAERGPQILKLTKPKKFLILWTC